MSSRFMPATTTSCTSGAPSRTMRARIGPTLTKVPVDSLKSSAMRPSNSSPRCGSPGSMNCTASPVR